MIVIDTQDKEMKKSMPRLTWRFLKEVDPVALYNYMRHVKVKWLPDDWNDTRTELLQLNKATYIYTRIHIFAEIADEFGLWIDYDCMGYQEGLHARIIGMNGSWDTYLIDPANSRVAKIEEILDIFRHQLTEIRKAYYQSQFGLEVKMINNESYVVWKGNVKAKVIKFWNRYYIPLMDLVVKEIWIPLCERLPMTFSTKTKGFHPQISTDGTAACIGDLRNKSWKQVYNHLSKIFQIANFDSPYWSSRRIDPWDERIQQLIDYWMEHDPRKAVKHSKIFIHGGIIGVYDLYDPRLEADAVLVFRMNEKEREVM